MIMTLNRNIYLYLFKTEGGGPPLLKGGVPPDSYNFLQSLIGGPILETFAVIFWYF